MHISIDAEEDNFVEGWKYTNQDGADEFVTLGSRPDTFIIEATGQTVEIYRKDIGKLRKALQAVEKYFKENE